VPKAGVCAQAREFAEPAGGLPGGRPSLSGRSSGACCPSRTRRAPARGPTTPRAEPRGRTQGAARAPPRAAVRAAAEPGSRDTGPDSRLPARRAHAPGVLPELEMPLRPRPPPALPRPLPHVGRAATATISGPLPLPLSLTDARPRRPSPSRSAHAQPEHAAAAGCWARAPAAHRPSLERALGSGLRRAGARSAPPSAWGSSAPRLPAVDTAARPPAVAPRAGRITCPVTGLPGPQERRS
jgi:hypothetical protein